jgi:Protein of unknown function (DUF2752)
MKSVPPKISSANTRFAAVILAVTAAGIAAMVFFFNPSAHNFYPVCQFHRLTGLNCPGCGMTRALYALLHGNFSTALRDNALFVFILAAAAIRSIWFGAKKFRGQTNGEFFPANFLLLLLAVALVFAVLRNLPAFAFLSP